MAIDSISSSLYLSANYGIAPRQEQNEIHQTGLDVTRDDDQDDLTDQSMKSIVNLHGQAIGSVINIKA
jgi:hypothetical protein